MKTMINSILEKFGYEIHHKKTMGKPFSDQALLVSNTPRPVIFDCGAHIGKTVLRYRKLVPKAKIFAFEPYPESFDYLKENTQDDHNTEIFCKAIARNDGKALLNCNKLSETNSLLKSDNRGDSYWGQGLLDTEKLLEVDAISIDQFCAEKHLEKIDILKLDIQGAEYDALVGAKRLLDSQHILLIYTEMLMMPTYQEQRKPWELVELLDKYEYELFNFYNPYVRNGQLIQSDAIFISRSFKQGLRLFQNPLA